MVLVQATPYYQPMYKHAVTHATVIITAWLGDIFSLPFVSQQVYAFFADHRVTQRPSRRHQLMPYQRQDERRPGPWQMRLAVRDLQPSKRLPPPMNVPVQRTRRFRCVFDLRRCRRHLVPSSVACSSAGDSRGPSRLLEDDEDTTMDKAPTDTGPLIVVKHFCKVSSPLMSK